MGHRIGLNLLIGKTYPIDMPAQVWCESDTGQEDWPGQNGTGWPEKNAWVEQLFASLFGGPCGPTSISHARMMRRPGLARAAPYNPH